VHESAAQNPSPRAQFIFCVLMDGRSRCRIGFMICHGFPIGQQIGMYICFAFYDFMFRFY